MIEMLPSLLGQVTIPTELEPTALITSVLTANKTTIIALITFSFAIGFIALGIAILQSRLGTRKRIVR